MNVLVKVTFGAGISVGVVALPVAEALGKLPQCGADGGGDVYEIGRSDDELPVLSSLVSNLRSLVQAILP